MFIDVFCSAYRGAEQLGEVQQFGLRDDQTG